MRDLGPQLEIVSSLVVGGTVGTQREHAASETGQVAHLPLQVSVLPLPDEGQTAVGLADQVALDGLERQEAGVVSGVSNVAANPPPPNVVQSCLLTDSRRWLPPASRYILLKNELA